MTVASVKLDRETKSVYYISVESTDPGGLKDTAQLTVNITDANDNPPEFRRDYDGYLKENDNICDMSVQGSSSIRLAW